MPYKAGDYLVICDQCGFQRYASECKMTWNNLFVCEDTCWEPKHPHYTSPKPLGEKQSVPVNRAPEDYNMVDSVDPDTLEPSVTQEEIEDGYFINTPITPDDL